MKRFLVLVFALLFALPYLASAGSSKTAQFDLSNPLLVGTVTLEPGSYTFQCLEIEGVHYIVVTSGKTEVARVKCEQAPLARGRVKGNEIRTTEENGVRVLRELRLAGEAAAHTVKAE